MGGCVKKDFRRWYAWIFVACLLGACGMIRDRWGRQEGGMTKFTVNVSRDELRPQAWPSIGGGIMVYVVGVDGTPFGTTIPLNPAGGSSAQAEISVPNGTYKAYALAWDGAGSNYLQGQIGCSNSTSAKTLAGTPENANLTITNTSSECGYLTDSAFSYAGYNVTGGNFPVLVIKACSSMGGTCIGTHPSYSSGASMLVRMEGYVRNGQSFERRPEFGLAGACATVPAGVSGTASTSLIIPPGHTGGAYDKFLGVSVAFYPSPNTMCSGTPSRLVFFPRGLVNGASDGTTTSVQTHGNLYVDLN